jgi:glyoxylase-like metal-dependent hydrolase (beta-lactamase superfamily II)/rhodanese-related sulfurtransferase
MSATATVTTPLIRQVRREGQGCFGYLIADPAARRAAIIDPRQDQVDEYLGLLEREGWHLEIVIDTHTHADHLSGAAALARRTGAAHAMLQGTGVEIITRTLADGETVRVGGLELEIIASPGHTPDGLTIHLDGNLFTGDTMLIGGSGRADFMGGDPGQLFDSFQKLARFPDDTVVWPAHDYQGRTQSTLGRERQTNVVFTAGGRDAVIAKLSVRGPLPHGMAEILTFNRKGTAPGVEIDAKTVHQTLRDDPGAFQIVDVRTPLEVSGESIEGAWNIPLDEFETRLGELSTARGPLVLTCETGTRALMAAQVLERRKFTNYRVMTGGIRSWVKAGLPHKRGRKVIPVMRQVQLGAGLLVLAGVALGTFVNPWFYAISAFVGLGLTVAGSTGFCGMALVLMRMPWNRLPPGAGSGAAGGSCQVGGVSSASVSGSCAVGGGGTTGS